TAGEIVKLADFGVALVTDASPGADAPAGAPPAEGAAFVGSFAYAAPEQLAGLDVGPRADLYSLGVVLYELATGVHPAAAAAGRVVVVTGEAGMGKSRLLAEWAAAVERGPGAPAVAFAAHAPGAGGAAADALRAAIVSLAARATAGDARPVASRIADLLGGDP